MKIGTVIGVYLSDEEPDSFGSIIVQLKEGGNANLLRCFPLSTNSRNIPVLGEQVFVLTASSDEASGTKSVTKNYYLSTVSLQKNINHNALPKLTEVEGTPVPNFNQVSNGVPNSGGGDDEPDFGNGFVEVPNLSQLQPFLGDIIYEGRFGQSIRFGYTPKNTKQSDNKIKGAVEEPSWKSDTPEAPITIFRNGAGKVSGYNKFVIEDVNEDASSMWMTSKQKVSLKPSNGFSLGVLPVGEYKNPQLILNSDRIILNSKSDSVLISGKKSVNVSTTNWKADMDIIFSQLEAITDALIQLAPSLTGAVTGVGAPIPLVQTAGPKLASAVAQIKTQLTLMKQ